MMYVILPWLSGAAMILVAQTQLGERSKEAALRLSIAGGLVAGIGLLSYFVRSDFVYSELGRALEPLAQVAAAGCAVWALMILVDAVNPVRKTALPPTVVAVRLVRQGSGLAPRIIFATLVLMGMAAFFESSPMIELACALSAVGAIAFGHLLSRRGNWAVWILERQPERVVWVYPGQLTVVSRRYGTRDVYWRAIIGLANGKRLTLPVSGEAAAGGLAAEVAGLCPDASQGYSLDSEAKFRKDHRRCAEARSAELTFAAVAERSEQAAALSGRVVVYTNRLRKSRQAGPSRRRRASVNRTHANGRHAQQNASEEFVRPRCVGLRRLHGSPIDDRRRPGGCRRRQNGAVPAARQRLQLETAQAGRQADRQLCRHDDRRGALPWYRRCRPEEALP